MNSFQNLYFLIFLNHRTKVYSRWRIAWSGEWDPCTQRSHSFWQHVSPFELDVIKTVCEVNHPISCLKSLWILHTHGWLCCTEASSAVLGGRSQRNSWSWSPKVSLRLAKEFLLLHWESQKLRHVAGHLEKCKIFNCLIIKAILGTRNVGEW